MTPALVLFSLLAVFVGLILIVGSYGGGGYSARKTGPKNPPGRGGNGDRIGPKNPPARPK